MSTFIRHALVEAFLAPVRYRRELLIAFAPLILVIAVQLAFGMIVDGESSSTAALFLVGLLYWIAFCFGAVSWHRLLVLGEPVRLLPISFGGRVGSYLLWSLLIVTLASLLFIIPFFVALLIVVASPADSALTTGSNVGWLLLSLTLTLGGTVLYFVVFGQMTLELAHVSVRPPDVKARFARLVDRDLGRPVWVVLSTAAIVPGLLVHIVAFVLALVLPAWMATAFLAFAGLYTGAVLLSAISILYREQLSNNGLAVE